MARIGSGQEAALLEAYEATISLLPFSSRPDFLLVGGASLVFLGSTRNTLDIDFSITALSLNSFEEVAQQDLRFSKGPLANWTYICQEEPIKDINVGIDFLPQDNTYSPIIKVIKPIGEGYRASMGELAKMKAYAYVAREEDKDLNDFTFLLEKMQETGEGFEGVELEAEDLKHLKEAVTDCKEKYRKLLRRLLRNAGKQW